MSFKGFQAILRFWQFDDYPESTDDRLSNICLMVNTFIKKCYDVLVPDKNLSLDESMMLWLERIVLKQYIKNKRHNYEIKFFELTVRDLPELKQTTNQHRKELVKSNVITDYNANMSGIDQSDQMLSCHSSLRKTVRWYKKVGVHILKILLTNARYIYLNYSEEANPLNVIGFKEATMAKLVGELKKTKAVLVKAKFNYPTLIPLTEKINNPACECESCSCRNNSREKESRYICALGIIHLARTQHFPKN